MPDAERARMHAGLAEQLLAMVDMDKIHKKGHAADPRDGYTASLAAAHATLALYYQQQATR